MRVGADDVEAELAAVDERGAAPAVAAGDDVCGGEHESVRGDHYGAPAAVEPSASAAVVRDAEVRDGGCQPISHSNHGAGVRVERLGVRELRRGRAVAIRPEEGVD